MGSVAGIIKRKNTAYFSNCNSNFQIYVFLFFIISLVNQSIIPVFKENEIFVFRLSSLDLYGRPTIGFNGLGYTQDVI